MVLFSRFQWVFKINFEMNIVCLLKSTEFEFTTLFWGNECAINVAKSQCKQKITMILISWFENLVIYSLKNYFRKIPKKTVFTNACQQQNQQPKTEPNYWVKIHFSSFNGNESSKLYAWGHVSLSRSLNGFYVHSEINCYCIDSVSISPLQTKKNTTRKKRVLAFSHEDDKIIPTAI